MANRRHPAIVVSTLLAACLSGRARGDDPGLIWRTLETPHFWVHYHEPLGPQAQRLARRAERAHEILAPLLAHAPAGRTHVVLRDNTDSANGSATVIPYNLINVLAVAPDSLSILNDFDDWMFDLIVHEYAHIVHLDTTHGWTRAYNAIFGKTFVWNAVQPSWFIEGLATYHESAQSSAGRVRSSLAEAMLRAATLADRAPSIDQLTGEQRAFPGGDIAYLLGSRFLHFIAERYGQEKLAEISHDYAGAAFPFGLNRSARRVLGKTYVRLYVEFLADLRRRHEAEAALVRERGETRTRRLTFAGRTLRYPRFSRDGREILFFQSDGLSHAAIRAVGAGGGPWRQLTEVTSDTPPSPAPGGDLVIERVEPWRTFYRFTDLFRWDAAEDRLRRLTEGARAREPAVAPDGRTIACAVIQADSSGLGIVPISGGTPDLLIRPENGRQVYTPAWSPDGKTLAYSGRAEAGYRDLFLYHLGSGTHRRLTRDRAMDLDPRFSPDGRTLFFSSDRTGTYNIFALDLADGRLWQVTNVLTAALQPDVSPDGRRLAFVGLSADGFDLHVMDLDATRFWPSPPAVIDRPPVPRIETAVPYPARPYQPIRDLYPRHLEIDWAFIRSQPLFVVLSASARDPVGHHGVAAAVRAVPESDYASFGGSYAYYRLWPTLGAQLERGTARRGGFVLDGRNTAYREERTWGRLFAGLPLLRLAEHSVSMDLRYTVEFLRNADADRYQPDPNDVTPRFPETGTIAGAGAGVSYRGARGYDWSVSPEEGRNLALRLTVNHEALGGDYHSTTVTWTWDEFLANPLLDRHVLSLRLNGGVSRRGDFRRRTAFAIGGFLEQDVVQDLLRLSFSGGGARLRGYPPGVVVGDQYHLLNAEYRFPLGELARGILTLPLYFKHAHMAAFADWGNAFRGEIDPAQFKLGLGGELRLELALGYHLHPILRLGYARGVDEGGIHETYVLLSSSF